MKQFDWLPYLLCTTRPNIKAEHVPKAYYSIPNDVNMTLSAKEDNGSYIVTINQLFVPNEAIPDKIHKQIMNNFTRLMDLFDATLVVTVKSLTTNKEAWEKFMYSCGFSLEWNKWVYRKENS